MTPPIIIDIEASGFGKHGYPIEVGFVTELAETWCSLIKPEDEWQHWDSTAEQAHKISREFLLQHGKPAALVAQQLNDRLLGKTVYTDGWGHDFIWMSRLFDSANTSPHFRLEDLRSTLTPAQESVWHETKYHVQSELKAQRHRASIDAKVLQLTWIRTLEMQDQS